MAGLRLRSNGVRRLVAVAGTRVREVWQTSLQRVEQTQDLRAEEGREDGIGGWVRNEHA